HPWTGLSWQTQAEMGTSATKNPPKRVSWGSWILHVLVADQELITILALNPLWRLATARPGFAGCSIARLGGNFRTLTAAAATTGRRENVVCGQTIIGHQSTRLGYGIGQFAATGFFDLQFQSAALLKQFLVRTHDLNILSK